MANNDTDSRERVDAPSLRRPAAFVTILDEQAKPRRSALREKPAKNSERNSVKIQRSPVNRIKRESVRAGSLIEDKALGTIRALGEVGKKIASLPGAVAEAASKKTVKEPLALRSESLAEFSQRARALMTPRTLGIILGMIGAAATLSVGAGALIGARDFPMSAGHMILPDEESVQSALIAYLQPESSQDMEGSSKLPPVPVSVKLGSYTIKSGDTIDKIAKRFGVRQDTIISANNLQSTSSIRSGVSLRIPNMDGISHKVRRGESLSSLSKTYGIDMTKIVDANDLASGTIAIGQVLFIPNARLSASTLRNFYGEQFVWPVRGRISSPYGYRANPFTGLRTYHSAIDIVVPTGTKVKATMEGTIADTGYNSVFGNYVIVKHSGGYQSLYAHLSSIQAREGSSVSQGAILGLSGNTGQSTGPHLHFSIFKNGQALDPTKYVK